MGPPMVPAPTHDGPARSDGAHGTGEVTRARDKGTAVCDSPQLAGRGAEPVGCYSTSTFQ